MTTWGPPDSLEASSSAMRASTSSRWAYFWSIFSVPSRPECR